MQLLIQAVTYYSSQLVSCPCDKNRCSAGTTVGVEMRDIGTEEWRYRDNLKEQKRKSTPSMNAHKNQSHLVSFFCSMFQLPTDRRAEQTDLCPFHASEQRHREQHKTLDSLLHALMFASRVVSCARVFLNLKAYT